MHKRYELAKELAAHVLPYLQEISKSDSEEDIKSDLGEILNELNTLYNLQFEMAQE